jgi:hypothetical protein
VGNKIAANFEVAEKGRTKKFGKKVTANEQRSSSFSLMQLTYFEDGEKKFFHFRHFFCNENRVSQPLVLVKDLLQVVVLVKSKTVCNLRTYVWVFRNQRKIR